MWPTHVENRFYSSMYEYYRDKGLSSIVATKVVHVITLGFTIVLSVVLMGFMDWGKLTECEGEDSCLHLSEYVLNGTQVGAARLFFVVVYTILFAVYWLWTVANLVPSRLMKMSFFLPSIVSHPPPHLKQVSSVRKRCTTSTPPI